jgi:hypothetical protein
VPLELDEDRDDLEVVEEDQAVDGDARLQPEAELDVRRAALAAGIENVTNSPWKTRPAGPNSRSVTTGVTPGKDSANASTQGRVASWIW